MKAHIVAQSSLGAGGGTGLSANTGSNGSGNSQTLAQVAGAGYSRILTPTLLLDVNAGYGRNSVSWVENDSGTNFGTGFLGIPGTNGGSDVRSSGLPSFAVSGYETFGNPDAYTPEYRNDNIYTYVGNLTYTRGAHTMRLGAALTYTQLRQYQPQRGFGPRGGFTFNGGTTALKGGKSPASANAFADFLLGQAATLGKSYQYLDPIPVNEWQDGIYAQDQWQVNRKLTLNYGVRWEYNPLVTRGNGRGLERYDLNSNRVQLGGINGQPSGGGTTANPHQFSPRFGFAYRAQPTTVIRGGYGISVDPYPLSRAMRDPYPVTIAQILQSTSTYLSAGNLAAGIPAMTFPDLSSGTTPLPLAAYTKTLLPGEYRRGYAQSFNITVEKELPAALVLATSYVGTRSIHQIAYIEANAGQTPGVGAGVGPGMTGVIGQPLYASFGRAAQTQVITPFHTAIYNGLQANLKRRFDHGLLLTASYTWSKSTDWNTDSDTTPLFNAVAYQYRNRAVSDFDRTNMFTTGFVAELPFGKGKPMLSKGLASRIAGGFQINGLFAAYSGLPFTATASAASLNAPFNTQVADQVGAINYTHGIGTNATFFDTTAFVPVTAARFGTSSRNQLRGPGSRDLDLGISRHFQIHEALQFEFRGEAFNVTNTPNFANPSNSVSSSSFGHITSTISGPADSRILRVSGRLSF